MSSILTKFVGQFGQRLDKTWTTIAQAKRAVHEFTGWRCSLRWPFACRATVNSCVELSALDVAEPLTGIQRAITDLVGGGLAHDH